MIVVNLDKAKAVAHNIRRVERAKEFEPHDKVIAAQIPGSDAAAAEAARSAIRTKYAAMQTAIDIASTPSEIKAALEAE